MEGLFNAYKILTHRTEVVREMVAAEHYLGVVEKIYMNNLKIKE